VAFDRRRSTIKRDLEVANMRKRLALILLSCVLCVAATSQQQVVAIIFAMIHHGGSGTTEGARLGVLIGIFVVCAFVLHNYVNLNIGLKLALGQAVAYFVQ
jgi:hypothetical protein